MNGINFFFIFVIYVLFSKIVQGQKQSPIYTYSFGGNVFTGFVLNHDSKMEPLASTSFPKGFELSIKKSTYGHKEWEELLNYPDLNLSVSYLNYNNPKLGFSVATLASMEYFLKRNVETEFFFNPGIGLVYTSNTYHKIDNPNNIAVSSSISVAMQLRFGLNFIMSPQLKLSPSITIVHYSNGAYKMPNMGINVPTVNVGVYYSFNKDQKDYRKNDPEGFVRDDYYHIISFSTGVRENVPGDPKYPFLNFSSTSGKMLTYTNAAIIGLDAFFSAALREELRSRNPLVDPEKINSRRVGVTLGHELIMGKLSLSKQIGYYVLKPQEYSPDFYQRYSLKYVFRRHYVTSVSLKSHLGKAEAIEWGFGVRF